MRAVSQAIQDILDSDYGETKDVVIITIKEQIDPPYPATVLYYANGDGVIIGNDVYENKLRSVGSMKFSLASSPDNAEIILENVSRDLGFILSDTQRIFDGAAVQINKAFKLSDGTFEAVNMFTGQISDTKIDQEAITFSVVSDMNKRGTSVAGRTITQRCIFKFNVNGSGVGPSCGWQTSQPGNPLSCDHTLDGPNGCRAHGNLDKVGAVPAFTILNSGNGYDPNGGGWGSGSGGGWCVHPESWILIMFDKKRVWIQARNLQKDDWIMSMNKFGTLIPSSLNSLEKGLTTQLITVTTKNNFMLKCSPSHPIITSMADWDGVPAGTLKVGDSVLVCEKDSQKPYIDIVSSIEIVDGITDVLMLRMDKPLHLFVAGLSKNGGIMSHNAKPAYTEPPFIGGGGGNY